MMQGSPAHGRFPFCRGHCFMGYSSNLLLILTGLVARGLRQTERAPKLSGSKFIKQTGTNLADSCPKAEHREQRGLSLYTI
jgi:hypothetical protein